MAENSMGGSLFGLETEEELLSRKVAEQRAMGEARVQGVLGTAPRYRHGFENSAYQTGARLGLAVGSKKPTTFTNSEQARLAATQSFKQKITALEEGNPKWKALPDSTKQAISMRILGQELINNGDMGTGLQMMTKAQTIEDSYEKQELQLKDLRSKTKNRDVKTTGLENKLGKESLSTVILTDEEGQPVGNPKTGIINENGEFQYSTPEGEVQTLSSDAYVPVAGAREYFSALNEKEKLDASPALRDQAERRVQTAEKNARIAASNLALAERGADRADEKEKRLGYRWKDKQDKAIEYKVAQIEAMEAKDAANPDPFVPGKTDTKELRKKVAGAMQFAEVSQQAVEILNNSGEEILGSSGDLLMFADTMAHGIKGAVELAKGTPVRVDEKGIPVGTWAPDAQGLREFKERNKGWFDKLITLIPKGSKLHKSVVSARQLESISFQLAYAKLTASDEGGRYSDFDMKMAMEAIGKSATDTDSFQAVLLPNVTNQFAAVEKQIDGFGRANAEKALHELWPKYNEARDSWMNYVQDKPNMALGGDQNIPLSPEFSTVGEQFGGSRPAPMEGAGTVTLDNGQPVEYYVVEPE